MEIFILLCPLAGAISAGLLGRWFGGNGSGFMTIQFLIMTLGMIIYSLYQYIITGVIHWLPIYDWFTMGSVHVSIGVFLDSLSLIMLFLITTISLLVHIYSIEYMRTDPHLPRFLSYLSLFTFFMIILVVSNNFVQLFIGWEGVGLCSYLLINFWFTRAQANTSSIKAVMVNRLGDFCLLFAICLLFIACNTFDFAVIFSLVPISLHLSLQLYPIHLMTLSSFFLLLAAVGKSAQIGLHTWLPDAMEGPTPVSALIHAATMVTAGIFLIIRCSPLFEYTPISLWIMVFIGISTAFFASIAAMFQYDLKKVIAYSTCSQLGYMFFSCGLSQYTVGLFHLFNHGFFKALLFLSAGSIIHAVKDDQDMRRMGGLYFFLPLTYIMLIIGILALVGFPFLAGFYSKDIILSMAYTTYTITAQGTFWCASMMALGTSLYSFQLLYYVFSAPTSMYKETFQSLSEPSIYMLLPLILLSFFSLFIGYLAEDLFIGLGSTYWGNSIFIHPFHTIVEFEYISTFILILPTILSICGGLFIYLLYSHQSFKSYLIRLFSFFFFFHLSKDFGKNWSVDNIYNQLIISKCLFFSYHFTFKLLDRGLFEYFGPFGLAKIISKSSFFLIRFYTGYLFDYFFMFVFLFLFCSFIFLKYI